MVSLLFPSSFCGQKPKRWYLQTLSCKASALSFSYASRHRRHHMTRANKLLRKDVMWKAMARPSAEAAPVPVRLSPDGRCGIAADFASGRAMPPAISLSLAAPRLSRGSTRTESFRGLGTTELKSGICGRSGPSLEGVGFQI